MTISPLDQLYLEATSKEDLLAEINDQRRQVVEARGKWAKADRELQELRKLKDAYDALIESSKAKDKTICRLRKAAGIKKRVSKRDITNMIDSGATDDEIKSKLGVHRSSIYRAKLIMKAG